VYFQNGAEALGNTSWRYRGGAPFRALPDIVLKVQSRTNERIVIIDAKNRSEGSASEVTYKLLGYRENLRLSPFLAVALFPSFGRFSSKRLEESNGSAAIALLRLPLVRARNIVGRLAALLFHLIDRQMGDNSESRGSDVGQNLSR
jgi:hypothetical protein